MALEITDDLRSAVLEHPGQPVRIHDSQSDRDYVLLEESLIGGLVDQWLRRELQIGFDQIDRGECVDWNPDQIKADARTLSGRSE